MTRQEAVRMIENDIRIHHDDLSGNYRKALRMAIEALKNSEQTAESSQNVSNDDLISRKAAIDALEELKIRYFDRKVIIGKTQDVINNLPAAQPEIIRCKDCKYRDENWRRVSVKWLPCMDVRTGSNWYCGSADRGEQE